MLSHHRAKAAEFRGLAAIAREKAMGAMLPRVRETEERAAARWESLAELEDHYIQTALARRSGGSEAGAP